MKKYKFYFLTGAQKLYGEEAVLQVNENSETIVNGLNENPLIPSTIVFLPCLKSSAEIVSAIQAANSDEECAGIICWMHTFSPSKMWIEGLLKLQKPYLHLNTQFEREIPWDTIDMNFMNLNQSAHGDREHGYIAARMSLPRKVIAGYWQDDRFASRIGAWMRSAAGYLAGRGLRVLRIGDNMRDVAVTEGDKIEAQLRLGWQVDYFATGDITEEIGLVSQADIDSQMEEYAAFYDIDTKELGAVRYQAKIEAGLKRFLEKEGFSAFHTNFQDLHGFEQLPGLAVQDLMRQGYGFAGEGDWKTAALMRVMKTMAGGLSGGTAFMEDYTYHLEKGNEMILGAHMLEVCPTLASGRPKIQVHPLSIGGKSNPARAVFECKAGKAIVASLVDMGSRLRLIVNEIECVTPPREMPKLPVARILWKPEPSLEVSAESWILCGGAHHSVLSFDITAEQMEDYAELCGIEFIKIDKNTTVEQQKKELRYLSWRYEKK